MNNLGQGCPRAMPLRVMRVSRLSRVIMTIKPLVRAEKQIQSVEGLKTEEHNFPTQR